MLVEFVSFGFLGVWVYYVYPMMGEKLKICLTLIYIYWLNPIEFSILFYILKNIL